MLSAPISQKTRVWACSAFVVLALLSLVAFYAPLFGCAVVLIVVLLVGVANALFGIRDRVIGLGLGGAVAPLVAATLLGFGLSWSICAIGAVIGALVGYAFGAAQVGLVDDEQSAEPKRNIKSGKGGDFGGGGAGGSF